MKKLYYISHSKHRKNEQFIEELPPAGEPIDEILYYDKEPRKFIELSRLFPIRGTGKCPLLLEIDTVAKTSRVVYEGSKMLSKICKCED